MALKESHVLERYFDRIAPSYERMNSLLSLNLDRYWRHRLLKSAVSASPRCILDVACGTGDVMRLLSRELPESRIIGLDLSHNMLREAHQRHPSMGYVRANGIQTPFPSQEFDLITISFGFRNMPSHAEFLKEARRLLKPGGRLLILELTQPKNPMMRAGNALYLKSVLPALCSMFGRDNEAYAYLRDSILGFPDQDEVCQSIKAAGFNETSYQLLTFGVTTLFTARTS